MTAGAEESGMRLVFWSSAAFIAYVYLGYPAGIALWARLCRRRSLPPGDGPLPGVSIVLAARNEASRLPGRIDNLLSLDYPGERQIIVVSDGSTDHTNQALAPYRDRVAMVSVPCSGKAVALNAGVSLAQHEILVFVDARQGFAPDALRALVRPFADPAIGGVTGELVLEGDAASDRRRGGERRTVSDATWAPRNRRAGSQRRGRAESTVADGVGFYWRYEKELRRSESAVNSTLGATGAIYALRRALWQPLPEGTILDDVLAPMRAVLAGTRIVFEPAAKAFDRAAADSEAESRRKIRTLAGNVQILWLEPRLLVPFVNPVWLQYMSHKVGRLLVPYALITMFAASLTLAHRHPIYALALGAQCTLYLLGGYGAWLELRGTTPPVSARGGAPANV
jgi:biofilm PGA synthesis N-glycosyltransferase PgaC